MTETSYLYLIVSLALTTSVVAMADGPVWLMLLLLVGQLAALVLTGKKDSPAQDG